MKLDSPPAYSMNFKKICVFLPSIADKHEFKITGFLLFLHYISMDHGKVSSLYCFITLKVTENAFRLHIRNYVANAAS